MAKVAKDALLNHYKCMANSSVKDTADVGLQNLNRLKSCCLPGSSQVFKVVPLLDRSLSAQEFRIWAKLRLGYPIFKSEMDCEYCDGVSDIHGQHLLKCEKAKNRGHIYRHNRFRDVVANLCRDIGCHVVVEANNLFDSSSERPADIYVENDSTKLSLAIDVSLTSPHIVDNKSTNSIEGYAANKRQMAKAQKYGEKLNKLGITCAPLVLENYGGYTTQTESAIINKLATAWAKNHSSFSWDHCKKNVIDRITIEHAKIIAGTFVQRLRPKDTENKIHTGFTMYDGSSGFKSWTNREKHQKCKVAMGPLSENVNVMEEYWEALDTIKEKTGDWIDDEHVGWGAEPKEAAAQWTD